MTIQQKCLKVKSQKEAGETICACSTGHRALGSSKRQSEVEKTENLAVGQSQERRDLRETTGASSLVETGGSGCSSSEAAVVPSSGQWECVYANECTKGRETIF